MPKCSHCDDWGGHNAYVDQPCPKCHRRARSETDWDAAYREAESLPHGMRWLFWVVVLFVGGYVLLYMLGLIVWLIQALFG